VAVVLHGGCWKTIADLHYMEAVAAWLVGCGWATWNLEFERLVESGAPDAAVWPGLLLDVGAGVDHLRTLAESRPIDLARVVTVGHSSGGHLALWAAGRPRIAHDRLRAPGAVPVRGVVSLAGIPDLAGFHALEERACGDAVVRLLGGRPDRVPRRLRAASPAEMLPLGVPQLLVTGARDPDVPPEYVDRYAVRAKAAGDDVTHVTIPEAGHFEVVAPWAPKWEEIGPAVARFLARV
jgi:acetyl esterase/lipase